MPATPTTSPRLPPRWFVRFAWVAHRTIYRLTGGRRGLWPPKADKWGTMRLTTVGRRTGKERSAILGYYEDGPNLVTLAMNGWAPAEPAWWLNLQAHPDASVDLVDGSRAVRARCKPSIIMSGYLMRPSGFSNSCRPPKVVSDMAS